MNDDNEKGQDIAVKEDQAVSSTPENTIQIGDTTALSVAGLTVEQIQTLRMKHADGMLDLAKKAKELQIDVGALDAALGTMASQTKQLSESGDHVTVTHSTTSALGRTEVEL